jgi:tRNA(Ile)-lysidine synthase TilS/MesJ
MEKYREIEKSIIKKFRKEIWRNFTSAIKEFNLVKENDKIAVCISGGKDSFLLAKCLEELKRHGKINFTLEYIVMNPGYNKENMDKIKENAKILNIDIKIFDADIFKVAEKSLGKAPCYLCARMRRGHLYSIAQSLGCNKIALGHHFNDVVETVLLNLFYNGTFSSMLPILKSDNFEGLELIRPLYYVKEEDIIAFSKYNDLSFIDCACSVTKKGIGKRKEIKNLVANLRKNYDKIDLNILNATKNVNLNTILGYKGKLRKDDLNG